MQTWNPILEVKVLFVQTEKKFMKNDFYVKAFSMENTIIDEFSFVQLISSQYEMLERVRKNENSEDRKEEAVEQR